MQKKIIALAVAGLASSAAFAQSANVTLYGVADACYQHMSISGPGVTTTKADNGVASGCLAGSRIGFRGEEALGSGLSAKFVIETGINYDGGNTANNQTWGGRQVFVSLASTEFGELGFGRQYHPGYLASVEHDTMAGSAIFGPLNFTSNAMGATGLAVITSNSDARVNNSVKWTSTDYKGLKATLIWGTADYMQDQSLANGVVVVPGAAATTTAATWDAVNSHDQVLGLGLRYQNGPWLANYVYSQKKIGVSAALGETVNSENFLGLNYDFGVAKLVSAYQTLNESGADMNNKYRDKVQSKLWNLGTIVPVGAGAVNLGYAKLTESYLKGDADGKVWTLGYTYPMSKRTTLYTAFTERKEGNAVATGGTAGTVTSGVVGTLGGAATGTGDSVNGFFAGINHTF